MNPIPMSTSRTVAIQNFQTNGQFDLHKFFEQTVQEGTPLYRFVDDMKIKWEDVAKKIGRSADECRSQYQYLLDCLFDK